MIEESSKLWQYLSQGQKDLIRGGYYLLEDLKSHTQTHPITDYSFLVFPFAKAYEGYLKQLFLDLGLIKKWQYESDHFRIGKALSPNLQRMLRKNSVYRELTYLTGNQEFADKLWQVWKRGRNQVFHYFPHNLAAVTLTGAEEIIAEIINTMEQGVEIKEKYKHRN